MKPWRAVPRYMRERPGDATRAAHSLIAVLEKAAASRRPDKDEALDHGFALISRMARDLLVVDQEQVEQLGGAAYRLSGEQRDDAER